MSKKYFFITILMIVCVLISVNAKAQVIEPDTAIIRLPDCSEPELVEDPILSHIWVKKASTGVYKDAMVHEIASNYIWFVGNTSRTVFHWDGANLIIVDLLLDPYEKSETGARTLDWSNDYAYTIQADGSLGANHPHPSMNFMSFSALSGWKNKKVHEAPFFFGYAYYNKRSTIYEGMILGGVDGKFCGRGNELDLYFSFDVIVEKNKITLKIYQTDFSTEERFHELFFERVFTVDK